MSKSDYDDDDGYERCVVTFFDILGFRALLKQRSASDIASMMSTFRLAATPDEPVEPVRRMKDARLYSHPIHARSGLPRRDSRCLRADQSGQSAERSKVMASKGATEAGSSSFRAAARTHVPS